MVFDIPWLTDLVPGEVKVGVIPKDVKSWLNRDFSACSQYTMSEWVFMLNFTLA